MSYEPLRYSSVTEIEASWSLPKVADSLVYLLEVIVGRATLIFESVVKRRLTESRFANDIV